MSIELSPAEAAQRAMGTSACGCLRLAMQPFRPVRAIRPSLPGGWPAGVLSAPTGVLSGAQSLD